MREKYDVVEWMLKDLKGYPIRYCIIRGADPVFKLFNNLYNNK
jgi:hypothetical protein